jgi:putative two-component system response regulator
VADDEPRLRQVLVRVMKSEGFECAEASTGREALELLAAAPTALLLTDLRMPEMDGLELLAQAHARYPELAIILITAVADVDVALQALTAGAMDYVSKPFRLEEIRARVGQALEKRQLIIENRSYQASLEQRVAEQARRIEELFLGGIQALVHALEVKDPYTRGHSIRVSRYSTGIARQIGMDSDAIRQIEIGGHVHDIGKIGVREEILNKEGPLTDAEYAHVMSHPGVGWQILSPLLDDSPLALNVVRSHHERYDGKGVPDGLRGESIPLEARLCSVTDAFDAMTSGRAYRRHKLGREDALTELERHAGTQFDPEMVSEFTRYVRSGGLGVPARTTPPTAGPSTILRQD